MCSEFIVRSTNFNENKRNCVNVNVDAGPPDQPRDVKVTAINSTTLEVTWSTVTETLEYRILYVTNGDNVTVTTNGTSYTINELTPGMQYTIGVAACNNAGCSSQSDASNNTCQ